MNQTCSCRKIVREADDRAVPAPLVGDGEYFGDVQKWGPQYDWYDTYFGITKQDHTNCLRCFLEISAPTV